MKRLLTALGVATFLVFVVAGVWASAGRQGTVPLPPREATVTCSADTGVFFSLGTTTIAARSICTLGVRLLRIEEIVYPPFPDFSYLLPDVIKITPITKNKLEEIEICTPLVPEWKSKKIGEDIAWYWWDVTVKWDPNDPKTNAWKPMPTEIKGSAENPPELLCGKLVEGRPEGFSFNNVTPDQPLLISLQSK
ncbi:MAG: hypothetical protein QXZ28_04020 [Candidatus Methanomethylicaceae archaeon]